jgi:hypothetical protein
MHENCSDLREICSDMYEICSAKQAVRFMRFSVICVIRFAVICMRFAVQNRRRYKTRQHKILKPSSAYVNKQFVLRITRILLLAPIIYSRRQSTVCTTYYSDIITCSHYMRTAKYSLYYVLLVYYYLLPLYETAKYSCDCTVATMMIGNVRQSRTTYWQY